MIPGPKVYLGDSVYVEFDGYSLVLTTENGLANDPSNRIVMEPEVYAALVAFVAYLKAGNLPSPNES